MLESISASSLNLLDRVDQVENKIVKIDMKDKCDSSIRETKTYLASKNNDIES
jgi:predicted RNA-binding protein with RPS1 domain